MATLTILPARIFKGLRAAGGFLGDEAASQTFKAGNLIAANGSGKFIATAAGATAAAAKNALALTAGQNLATPTSKVNVQTLTDEHVLDITAGGAASSAANIIVGGEYGYAIDGTTGLGYLNLADTTNKVFRIVSNVPTRGVIGDTNVGVQAMLLTGVRL